MTPLGKWLAGILTSIMLAFGGYCLGVVTPLVYAHSGEIRHLQWHDAMVEKRLEEMHAVLEDVHRRVIRIETKLEEHAVEKMR